MSSAGWGLRGRTIAMVALVVIVVLAIGVVSLTSQPGAGTSSSSSTTSSSSSASSSSTFVSCTITGQPGGIYLRVLSDSTDEPVLGAHVTATNTPFDCDGQPATSSGSVSFVTNDTEWYALPSENNYEYTFAVSTSGHAHTFDARLGPVSMTCATIMLPSGVTNVTVNGFGNACPAAYPSQALLSSSTWKFSASINMSLASVGEPILLDAAITNISHLNQTISPYVDPPFNPIVYDTNGTKVWAWNPPLVTWLDWNVTSGQSIGVDVTIPTADLTAGQSYFVDVAPISSQFPQNFTASFLFSVQ